MHISQQYFLTAYRPFFRRLQCVRWLGLWFYERLRPGSPHLGLPGIRRRLLDPSSFDWSVLEAALVSHLIALYYAIYYACYLLWNFQSAIELSICRKSKRKRKASFDETRLIPLLLLFSKCLAICCIFRTSIRRKISSFLTFLLFFVSPQLKKRQNRFRSGGVVQPCQFALLQPHTRTSGKKVPSESAPRTVFLLFGPPREAWRHSSINDRTTVA